MAEGGKDLDKKVQDLKISDKNDINILLIGETGVGKSTFVNAIANYLTYTDWKRAEKEPLLVLIPMSFQEQDKNNQWHNIKIGPADVNEYLEVGESATQDVKTYVFPIKKGERRVRLIDTPGMADTRGTAQDAINCDNILSYIGQLHELHAVCFLFKSDYTRKSVTFEYCIKEIFTRLDKSASKNIIFCFTRTRGTDYGPGDTISILQSVVEQIRNEPPNVDIPLNRNIFCFDNEAFRYLAAVQKNVEFGGSKKDTSMESWKNSVTQCWNMINYIIGDGNKNPPLRPHHVKSTNAINEARRMINQLTKPLVEISQLINQNTNALDRHKENLSLDNNSLEELKKKLYMPVIDLEVIKLTQPVTVCSSRNCAEIYQIQGKSNWHYKQRCHDPCFLPNVPKEIIGSPELVNCAAIDRTTRCCIKCSCDFSIHMHVYYMTKTKDGRVMDSTVEKNINSKEKLLQTAQKIIKDIKAKKEELDKEHLTIVTCSAKFAHFLQTNALAPFNDSYKEYVEYLINREKALGHICNMSTVRYFESLLETYKQTKQSFDKALLLDKELGRDMGVSPKQIADSIQELYKLKHTGKKIRELYECQKKARSKEYENTEYVHKVAFKKHDGDFKQDNGFKKDKDSKKDHDFKKGKEVKKDDFKKDKEGKKDDFKKDKDAKNAYKKDHDYKTKQGYNSYNKGEGQDQSRSSQPRSRTPPPTYRDAQRGGYHPSAYPHYPPPQGGYPPPNYHPQSSGVPPYTPPPMPHPSADPYAYPRRSDGPPEPRRDNQPAYDINITLKPKGERKSPEPHADKRDPYYPGPPSADPYYHSRPYYPPAAGGYPPPPGPYPSTASGAYPPPPPHSQYPFPGAYGPPAPGYPYPAAAPPDYDYHHGVHRPQEQHGPPRQGYDRGRSDRGRGDRGKGYRGGQGQKGGINRNYRPQKKYKAKGEKGGSDSGSANSD